jgi:hypothetical protein
MSGPGSSKRQATLAPTREVWTGPRQPCLAAVRARTDSLADAHGIRREECRNKTSGELALDVTPRIAARTLVAQAEGKPREGPAPAVSPAESNDKGCWLGQGRGQAHGGHCQAAPLHPRLNHRARNGAGAVAQRRTPQLLHRLAIRAWGTEPDLRRMVVDGWDVSHLCHNPRCFNIVHLVVESHHGNMVRRNCDSGGRACRCDPPCML